MSSIAPDGEPVLTRLGIEASHLTAIRPRTRRIHCRAIINWLTKYQASPSAPNLEQIRGYLESFHHLCEIGEWERAAALISTRLNTPTQELAHYQLKLWGHYQEQINLYSRLVGHLNPRWNGMFTNFLGIAHLSQGNTAVAIDHFQQSLQIAREIGDRFDEGSALSSLGGAHFALGNYRTYLRSLGSSC